MIEENNIFTNKEISIAKLITKYFIKSKALIERNFMLELSDSIDDSLETYGFVFSKNSNILVEDFPDDNQIDEIYDLNTIYKARQIRQRGFAPKESEEYYQELRDNTKSYLIYEKILDENEYLCYNFSIKKDDRQKLVKNRYKNSIMSQGIIFA